MTTQRLFRSALLAAPLGAAFVFLAGSALAATDADLARCRAVADAAARLVCYDALSLAAPPAAGTSPPTAVAVLPAPVAVPASSVPAAAGFGFEMRAIQSAPEAMDSRVPGLFDGWERGTRIRLDNGQVWQVIDDSRAYIGLRDPKVRISRAAMGSFIFEVEGRRSAARVRRVE